MLLVLPAILDGLEPPRPKLFPAVGSILGLLKNFPRPVSVPVAIDRGNPRVADRYDVLSPALLSAVRDILRKCDDAGVPVSLCGEMAGDPLEAMALLGIGMRSLSLSPPAFGAVKAMTLTMDTAEVGAYMNTLLQSPDHSLRRKLGAFALDHGIVLET